MEVLRSSEALESQILDDARAKAARILQEAEREAAAVREEWRRKAEAESQRLDRERDARTAAIRQELEASLPLDFMRARLSFVEDSVSRALADFFSGLGPAELADVIGGFLRSVPPVFGNKPLAVTPIGIPAAQATKIVEESIPGVKVGEVRETPAGSEPGTGAGQDSACRGVIVETPDGRVRFRGTTAELTALLLEERREELADALLGKDM